MPTPAAIMDMSSSLLNDTAQTVYDDAALLPYLNMALDELQERFQLANIPVTNETSAAITVPAGTTVVSFGGSPSLPPDLVEIRQLWERESGVIPWIPMTKREFIPHAHEDHAINQFLFWSWIDQEIHLIESTANNDLKIDYIKNLFPTPVQIADIEVDIPIINTKQFLGYKTAALAALFIMEDEYRSGALTQQAELSMDRALGIPTKGKQSIVTRRQPFMGSYHRRSYV